MVTWTRQSQGRLPKRTALRIWVISTLITFVLTMIQLAVDWKNGVNQINQTMDLAEKSFAPQLARAVWFLDTNQMETISLGVITSTRARHLKIVDSHGETLLSHGKSDSDGWTIARNFTLTYDDPDTGKEHAGSVEIESDLWSLASEIMHRLGVFVINQFVKTLIVTFAIIQIVHKSVSIHLVDIVDQIKNIDIRRKRPDTVTIKRPPTNGSDELDDVVTIINKLGLEARSAYEALEEKAKERDKLQEEVREDSQRIVLSQMASGTLHDINNFLSVIPAHLKIIADSLEGELTKIADGPKASIIKSLARAQSATDGACNMARMQMQSFKVQSQSSKINLKEAIEGALSIQERFISRSSVKVELIDNGEVIGYSVKGIVMSIIVNLIKNAIEAIWTMDRSSTYQGKVTISYGTDPEHGCAFIRVSDNGPGLTQESLEKIFTGGQSTKSSGHGIGLNFCKKLASTFGGDLKAESKGPRQGASFILQIPIKQEQTPEENMS